MSNRKDPKVWVKIKRGMITDPKHRQRLGSAIWLYFMLIDEADWEMGVVDPYKDEDMAEEMAASVSWVRQQRRLLEKEGYIECRQLGQKGQQITITKWINPKSYSGEVKNIPTQSGENVSPSKKSQSVKQSDTQSGRQSDTQSVTPAQAPTLYPGIKNQEPVKPHPAVALWEREVGTPINSIELDTLKFLASAYSEKRQIEAMRICVKREIRRVDYYRGVLIRGDTEAGHVESALTVGQVGPRTEVIT